MRKSSLIAVTAGCLLCGLGGRIPCETGVLSSNCSPGPEEIEEIQLWNVQAQRSYWGQLEPGMTPEIFAPGVFSTPDIETGPVFSADGREMFWTHAERSPNSISAHIMTSHLKKGFWTQPAPLPFSINAAGICDTKPVLAPDGRMIVFASTRPIPGRPEVNEKTRPGCVNLWHSRRTAGGWGKPAPFGPEINTASDEDCPQVAADGSLYFYSNRSGSYECYLSRPIDGRYANPEITSQPGLVTYLSAKGTTKIFQRQSRTLHNAFDIFVAFLGSDGSWENEVDISSRMRAHGGYGVTASPDGKFLFFMSDQGDSTNVFWMRADFSGMPRNDTEGTLEFYQGWGR